MTKKHTKRALLSSVLALILCFSMLVGTTFAWFTDSAASGRNKIAAGNLDVELYHTDKNGTEQVTNATTLFDDVDPELWEPGAVAYETLEVKNVGSLALKFNLNLTVLNETIVNGYKVSDVIKVGTVDGGITSTDRTAVINSVTNWVPLSQFNMNMESVKLEKEQSKTVGVVLYWQPNDNEFDNRYNMNNTNQGSVLSLDIGVELVATQVEAEFDSFGDDYDSGATNIPAWDGAVAEEVPAADENGVVTISTAAELAAFAADVNGGNTYSDKTVVLAADINLGNQSWSPIGDCNSGKYFQGTFDGQGNTIYNLYVDKSTDADENSTAGLFGWIDAAGATIKNVNVNGATVKGSHWTGTVVGFMSGTISGCNVTNANVSGYAVNEGANGDKMGGVVGHLNDQASMINNSVSNSTIHGNRDVGGLVGGAATTVTMTGNSVKNSTVSYVTEKDYASAGAIVSGRTGFEPDSSNTAINVTIIKGTEVAEGVYEVGTRSYEVTSAAGLMNVNTIIANTSTAGELYINVKLMNDVDMSGYTWTPINTMFVNFDGNGNTIKNLTTSGERSGLYAYQGGGTISNLTLENVTSSGAQAGTFVGLAAGTIENCYLKGNNTINWVDYGEDNEGIGAISGVISGDGATINATIDANATVTLNYNDVTTNLTKVDDLTGYLGTNGGTVTNNGTIKINKSATAATAEELSGAIADGANEITLTTAGTYDISSASGKDSVTINGTTDTVIKTGNGNGTYVGLNGADVTFNGVTIQGQTSGQYNGYAHAGTMTYNKCTIEGTLTIYSDTTFTDCTFNLPADCYIWSSWGGATVTFDNCTFNTAGKAILIYGESKTGTVNVKNCKFNATEGDTAGAIANQNCAAIEIDNSGKGVDTNTHCYFTVNTSGNTYSDKFSGEWRIKTFDPKGSITVNKVAYNSIAIDGKTMTKDASNNVTVNE